MRSSRVIPIVLYGRDGCHLCDVAAEALVRAAKRLPIRVDYFDIDGDVALEARFGERIPVVADASGAILCEGKVSETRLRASLRTLVGSR